MLITIFTFVLQFQLASVYSETTTGKETLFTRVSNKLSWKTAREACDNMSYSILPGMRAARALGNLHAEEFAWIDGEEYTLCMPTKDGNETKKTCRYVTMRREDENLTYICQTDGKFEMFADVENKCLESSASMEGVETFKLPVPIPFNRTYWMKGFNDTSIIINSLSLGHNVTQLCIGIVKLDQDSFKFVTTSCDETHTVICDRGVASTELTVTVRDVMIPRLGDLKASKQPDDHNLIFLVLYSTVWVIPFAIILVIAIVKVRKKRFAKGIVNNSVYRTQRFDRKRKRDQARLPQNYSMWWHNKSESKSLPFHSRKIEGQGNYQRDSNDDEAYDNFDPQLHLYENPINTKTSTFHYHIQGPDLLAKQAAHGKDAESGENEKGLLTDWTRRSTQKYLSMHRNETNKNVVMDTDNEKLYENMNQADISLECHYDNTRF
ncbi:hypothetical protein ACJMK2_021627 [Sinanodonta woodiana]|uniref:C-type lectin domain-containing protein n=1 Tax=Sinanodonta woodiana TaxID=1069815 RepID=A0ABD3TIF2_SINWO